MRIEFTKVSLPPKDRYFAFQVSNLALNLSIPGAQSLKEAFLKCKGKSRYLIGKGSDVQPIISQACSSKSSWRPKPVMEDLLKLIFNLEQAWKQHKILLRFTTPSKEGVRKITVSSAY